MAREPYEASAAADVLRVEIPAAHAYLHLIGPSISCLFNNAPSSVNAEGLAYNIELAVHEVCTNIIEHAYGRLPGRIKIVFTMFTTPQQLVIELFDNGRSFEYASIPVPSPDEPQIRGYGLFLIQALMDEVEYCPKDNGNTWRLVKNLA